VAVAVAVAILGAACTSTGPDQAKTRRSGGTERPIVYAAVGASETVGIGTDDPFEDAWPRVLWRTLPTGSVLYDFGVSGSTVRQALREQAGAARAVDPELATVWLNVNDLLNGVKPVRFGRELRHIVHRLRGGGQTTVLVANTPRLDSLPLYLACRSEDGSYVAPLGNVVMCGQDTRFDVLPSASVRAAVDAYNRQIERVVRQEGAILVDLFALGDVPNLHPDYVSLDGFHPSTKGAQAVAVAFGRALATDRSVTGGTDTSPKAMR
jgi:acyl-CoA thioesterase-1